MLSPDSNLSPLRWRADVLRVEPRSLVKHVCNYVHHTLAKNIFFLVWMVGKRWVNIQGLNMRTHTHTHNCNRLEHANELHSCLFWKKTFLLSIHLKCMRYCSRQKLFAWLQIKKKITNGCRFQDGDVNPFWNLFFLYKKVANCL